MGKNTEPIKVKHLAKVIRLVELRFRFRQPGSRASFLSCLWQSRELSGCSQKGEERGACLLDVFLPKLAGQVWVLVTFSLLPIRPVAPSPECS